MGDTAVKKLPLQIFAGLSLGIITGLLLMAVGKAEWAEVFIQPFGTVYLNLIKFIVVPVVFTSVISGVVSMKDMKKVGAIGGKTVLFYMCTTAAAITLGLLFASLFRSGFQVIGTGGLTYQKPESISFMETFVNLFPANFAAAMTGNHMLQLIVAALLIGFGMILAGEGAKPFEEAVDSFGKVCIRVMELILRLSPFGVFCLITPVIAENGAKILGTLAAVLLAAYLCYALHMLAVYSAAVKGIAGISPVRFFKEMAPAMLFAFSSTSSMGTLPLNMECTDRLGAKSEVSGFVLPLGATLNMDGTAIYQGICAVFIASCYGIELSASQMITMVLTATLASVGTAGVPGAGLLMLAMVLQSVGLPVEGIALVAGVDRIFDMGRTVVNITGDAACTLVISSLEEKEKRAS